jgi:hypothetical protein
MDGMIVAIKKLDEGRGLVYEFPFLSKENKAGDGRTESHAGRKTHMTSFTAWYRATWHDYIIYIISNAAWRWA